MTSSGGAKLPAVVFGPVPSRRLGRSIGINNIPPKVCSFACVYCQVGPTLDRATDLQDFYEPQRVADEVAAHITRVRDRGEDIDYLTFVPDGEPTLDAGLEATIGLLRPLNVPIAVITNGSLLWRADVRNTLGRVDWVSVKVDAATEEAWRRVNRPAPELEFTAVLDGIERFATAFNGELVSETMLIAGMNDGIEAIRAVGEFLHGAGFTRSYLSIPTRPTPFAAITAPDEETVNRAFHELADHVPQVEYLVGYEGDEFASTGDARTDLLDITAVHPMRVSAVQELLHRSGAAWSIVDDLVAGGSLIETTHRGETFYVRRFSRPRKPSADRD